MKTKILVLGSTGMLGHMALKVLSAEKTFKADGTHLDNKDDPFYFNTEEGMGKLDLICEREGGYDYFINCIGITKDKIDEEDPESILRAERVNAVFPHELARFAEGSAMRIIHISTDGVFSGKSGYYDEDAPCDCADIYGKTKRDGEVKNGNVLIIRCSILGPSPFEKRGLFEWFHSQKDGSTIRGYTNHLWSGATTLQFAELCLKIILANNFDSIIKESNIHHFCPNRPVSKYDLLIAFRKISDKNIEIAPFVDKKSPVEKILTTKYDSLNRLFGGGKDIGESIGRFKMSGLS